MRLFDIIIYRVYLVSPVPFLYCTLSSIVKSVIVFSCNSMFNILSLYSTGIIMTSCLSSKGLSRSGIVIVN